MTPVENNNNNKNHLSLPIENLTISLPIEENSWSLLGELIPVVILLVTYMCIGLATEVL